MTTKIDRNLSEIFDLDDSESEKCTDIEVIDSDGRVLANSDADKEDAEHIDTDYKKTRTNLYSMLAQGQAALETALSIAQSTEDPKAFRAYTDLLKTLSDLNKDLLDTHERKQKVTGKITSDDDKNSVTNNNAIFVGTTSELKQMLKDLKN